MAAHLIIDRHFVVTWPGGQPGNRGLVCGWEGWTGSNWSILPLRTETSLSQRCVLPHRHQGEQTR